LENNRTGVEETVSPESNVDEVRFIQRQRRGFSRMAKGGEILLLSTEDAYTDVAQTTWENGKTPRLLTRQAG
jgi:hypothetical protein